MTNEETTILNSLDIEDLLFEIEDEQSYYLEIYNTYLQFLKDKDEDIKSWVHEYLTPNNKRGYQVFFSYLTEDKEFIKSIGYGEEGIGRTHDWQEIIKDI